MKLLKHRIHLAEKKLVKVNSLIRIFLKFDFSILIFKVSFSVNRFTFLFMLIILKEKLALSHYKNIVINKISQVENQLALQNFEIIYLYF